MVTKRGYRRWSRAETPGAQSFADRKQLRPCERSARRYVRPVPATASFDVILPVLDEVRRVALGAARAADGVHRDRRRQRVDRRLGRPRPRARCRRRRRAAPWLRCGLLGRARRRDRRRRRASWTATARSAATISSPSWHRCSKTAPTSCSARATGDRGPGRCTRASPTGRWPSSSGGGPACGSRTSVRCARRAGAICSASGSSTADSAGRSRWCCARRPRGGASRSVRSDDGPRIGRSKVTGTVGGTLRAVRDMAGVLR